jgi:ABC-type uncharacterized transport system substrate-binding protein
MLVELIEIYTSRTRIDTVGNKKEERDHGKSIQAQINISITIIIYYDSRRNGGKNERTKETGTKLHATSEKQQHQRRKLFTLALVHSCYVLGCYPTIIV